MEQERPATPSPNLRQGSRTLHHQLLGKLLEIVLAPVDITVESEVQVMSTPPKADVLLLRRQGRHWSEEQRRLLPDGIRDRDAQHHLLECKLSESVSEVALQQALGYDFFYRQSQGLAAHALQTYVISAKTPHAPFLDKFGYRSIEQPGVYTSSLPLLEKVVMLVLNELRDEPHNEFLRLFASRQQIRATTINHVLGQSTDDWPAALWAVVFGLQRVYHMEGKTMSREMTVEDVMQIGEELRRQAIASATLKELSKELRRQIVAAAPIEERLAGLAPEERLTGLAPEERLAGLAPEEMARLLAQIETQLAGQANVKPQQRKTRRK